QAQQTYERAANAGKKASLVSQERPNVFTTSVANIAPGELVSVTITYQQDVRYDQGEFSLLFPSTLTPRYTPGASGDVGAGAAAGSRVPDASRIIPPLRLAGGVPFLYGKVALDAAVPLERVESPSHPIAIEHLAADRVGIRLDEGPVLAVRDFRLRWRS